MIIRGVILDVDGTLVDSNEAHVQSWVEALAEHGYDVPAARIRKLMGMGGDNLLPAAIGVEKESPQGKKISDRRGEIFKSRYLSRIRPLPGAHELLEQLRNDGLKLVVATSAPREEMEPLLRLVGAEKLVEAETTASDAERSKPAPDIVEAAIERSGLAAGELVMLGDTPYDVQAAGKAGVPVIAFRSGGFADAELGGAVALYDGPADLLAHYDASLLARAGVSRS